MKKKIILQLYGDQALIVECLARVSNCSLSRYNAKGKLECFNCKTGVFVRLFTPMSTKRKQLQSTFLGKSHLLYREYLTIIKKN